MSLEWICLAFLALVSCGPGGGFPQASDKDVMGGGPLVPWKNAQDALSSDGSFAAVRVGEPDLLIYVEPDSNGKAQRVKPPNGGCDAFPVAIAVGEVIGDGSDDVLVFDPGCGNWLASARDDGSYEALPWVPALPELTTRHFLGMRDLDFNGLADVSSSTSSGLQILFRESTGWRASESWFDTQPQTNPMAATEMFFRAPSLGTLLFQRGSSLEVLKVADGRIKHETTRQQEAIQLLREFDGYDQLVSLGANDVQCADFGAAVGTFNDQPKVPRRLNLLSLTDAGYRAQEIPTQGDQVLMVAGLDRGEGMLLGAISMAGRQFLFELLDHRECGVQHLGAWSIEPLKGFTVAPKTADDMMINNAGERLLAIPALEDLRFQHYDGTSLHIYEIGTDGTDFRERTVRLE